MLILASQSLPDPILALLKGFNGASCSNTHVIQESSRTQFSYHFVGSHFPSPNHYHTFGLNKVVRYLLQSVLSSTLLVHKAGYTITTVPSSMLLSWFSIRYSHTVLYTV